MKTIEQFYNEIIESKQLAKQLEEAVKSQKLDEFFKENEVEGTAEQFKAYVLEREKNSGELSDEELDAVVGGTFNFDNKKSFLFFFF